MSERAAFPTAWLHEEGMSLRDYFAGQTIIGMLTNQDLMKAIASGQPDGVVGYPAMAAHAYKLADALLAERLVGR